MANKRSKKSTGNESVDNFDVTEDCALLQDVLARLDAYKTQKEACEESIRQYVALVRKVYTGFIAEGFSEVTALSLTKHTIEMFLPQGGLLQ